MWRIIAILFALMLFPTLAEAQQVTRLCVSTNSTQTNCVPITTTFGLTVGGTANAVAPTYSEGQVGAPLSFDLTGNLRTSITGTTTLTPGTAATNLGKAEDAVHSSGDTGVFVLGVSNEAQSTLAADGDYIAHATDTKGNALIIPTTSASSYAGLAPIVSTAAESNHVLKSSAGNLYSLTITIGATSGYLMIFDATSLPSNGAVTPKYCYPVISNGTNGGATFNFSLPYVFATGITAGFSTTGCFTLTASATGNFFGQIK